MSRRDRTDDRGEMSRRDRTDDRSNKRRWPEIWMVVRGLIRRLGMGAAALFGISLVTFFLVNLAARQPEVGAAGTLRPGGMSAEERENLRRTFGLDLPVFINLHVMDRGRRVRKLLVDLADSKHPAKVHRAEAALVRFGTLAFPELAKHLKKAQSGSVRVRLERVARSILTHAGWVAPVGGWRGDAVVAWWQDKEPRFHQGAIERVVADVGAGRPGPGEYGLMRLGRRAVPALIGALLARGASAVARQRYSLALGRITGHRILCEPGAPKPELRACLGSWKDYWRSQETRYRDLSSWERFAGVVTRTRYFRWLARMVTGDFGASSYYRRRVWDVIMDRLPVTVALSLAALILAYLIAVPVGVWSASRRGGWPDRVLGSSLLVLYAMPSYVVALALILFLGGIRGPALFPTSGLHSLSAGDYPWGSGVLDLIWHAALPVLCLCYGTLAVIARYQRASMANVLGQEFILAARSRGIPARRVLWRHGLRNGIIPVVNLLGLELPQLVSGAVIVETIFDIPGMGNLAMIAIWHRDLNVLMGVITVAALFTLVGLALGDLLTLWADPRIRRPEART